MPARPLYSLANTRQIGSSTVHANARSNSRASIASRNSSTVSRFDPIAPLSNTPRLFEHHYASHHYVSCQDRADDRHLSRCSGRPGRLADHRRHDRGVVRYRRVNADECIRTLDLQPHPEGGFFRETWRAPAPAGERDRYGHLLPAGSGSRLALAPRRRDRDLALLRGRAARVGALARRCTRRHGCPRVRPRAR